MNLELELKYEELAYEIFGGLNNDLGNCLEIEVQNLSDMEEPRLIAWYSVNGDVLNNIQDNFFKEIDKLEGFDETEPFYDENLLAVYLNCNLNTKQESINCIIKSLNEVTKSANRFELVQV